jgi:beta-lactamase class C
MRKTPFRNIIFIIIISIALYASAYAQDQIVLSFKMNQFIDNIETQINQLQGGAIAILYKDQVIYKKTFGYQQNYYGPVITANTLFPLASISKSVSATALALMAENNLIDFDTHYRFSYFKNIVSLKNILSHTTGYQVTGSPQIEYGIPRQKILAQLKYQKPKCRAGECYFYSNLMYSLAEEALNTKGLSLQAAIQNLQTSLNTSGIQILPLEPNAEVAYPHNKIKKNIPAKTLSFPRYYPKTVPAAAGVFASIDGMIEFFKLSFGYRPDLISQKTLLKLYTPVITNHDINRWHRCREEWPCARNKIGSYYGLGWRILKPKQYPKKDLIFHAGIIAGISTFIGYIPAEQLGIIILVNQNSCFPMQTGIKFWREFF